MTKYVAMRPPVKSVRYSSVCDDEVMDDTCVVFEQDDTPIDTGLVDASGTSIYRLTDKRPIGFMRDG